MFFLIQSVFGTGYLGASRRGAKLSASAPRTPKRSLFVDDNAPVIDDLGVADRSLVVDGRGNVVVDQHVRCGVPDLHADPVGTSPATDLAISCRQHEAEAGHAVDRPLALV